MVTLYAVVQQEIVNINFNPTNGEGFGQVDLTIVTQTQYPFALRNFTDPDGAALIRTISGDIDGDPQWISSENPETCTPVDGVQSRVVTKSSLNLAIMFSRSLIWMSPRRPLCSRHTEIGCCIGAMYLALLTSASSKMSVAKLVHPCGTHTAN
jgi:hypothetical protein